MRRCQTIFILLGLGLLFLAAPLSAAVRINEILFAPGGGNAPNEEFIELYNAGPGSVDLQGWKLWHVDDLLHEFPDQLPLAVGEYLVIYIGSPAAPPLNSISLGYDTEQLDDYGAFLFLENDLEVPVDYVAYGGVVSNPPAPLVFPSPVSLASYWQTGDSIAYLEQDGTSNDDYRQWINRRGANITPGSANTRQTEPTLSYGTITEPANFPIVNVCEEVEIPLEISYGGETPLRDVTVEFTIPDGSFYVSASDGGVFNDATRTISWSLGILTGDRTVSLRLKASCDAAGEGSTTKPAILGYQRYVGQTPLTVNVINTISNMELREADLEVSIVHYPSGEPAIVAKPGLVVEFQIVITNKGTGALLNSSSSLELIASPHSLSLLGFRQNGPSGQPIDNLVSNVTTGTFTGKIGTLAAGATKIFYLKLLTTGCPVEYACTKATVTWGCADAAPGTQSCSREAFNTSNVYCPPEVHFIAPPGEPSVYSGCQNVKRQVEVHNPNRVPMEPQGMELQLPQDYYWVHSSINGTAAGVYDQTTGKVTFTAAELSGGTGEIPANSSTIIDLVMRPGCTAVSDRALTAVLGYDIICPMRTYSGEVTERSSHIKLLQASLSVAVQNPLNPALTTVEAERGQLVTFHVVAANNGMGNMNSDGKPLGEEGGWLELEKIGAGLQLDTVVDITDGGAGTPIVPSNSPDGNPRWPTSAINAGGKRTYEVKFLVVDCTDVSYDIATYWTCEGTHEDDFCRQDGESKGSVNIILRNPLLSIAVNPFTINYCDGVTVTIPVTNADGSGIGTARNVSINMLGMNLADYEIIDDPNSDFEFTSVGNIAIFNLSNGITANGDGIPNDLPKNTTSQLIFTVKLKPGRCDSSTGGELIFQPYYEDSCGIPFTAGTMLGNFSRTSPPEATLTKRGPGSALAGDTDLTWTIELVYNGEPNAPFEYTLVDNYPSVPQDGNFATFAIKSVSDTSGLLTAGTDYTDNGDIITRTVATTFDADGNYSETYTIVFDAPNTPCAGGQHYTNRATVNILTPAAPADCNDCPMWITENSNSTIAIFNAEEPEINGHARRVTYENINVHGLDNGVYQEAGEACTKITFDHLVRFTGTSPSGWEVDVDPGPDVDLRAVLFYDHLDNRMRAPGGIKNNLAVEVYYFSSSWEPGAPGGADHGPGGGNLVTWNDITYVSPGQGSGYLQINLKGLDGLTGAGPRVPSDGGVLWIRYTVESQQATGEMYGDFARLSVPNIGGDLCGLGPETHYYQFVPVLVVDPQATVAVSNVSSPDPRHIDRCETATYRFTLGSEDGRPFDHYDVRLVVDLQGNYRYIPNSTVFGSNLRDEGGQPLVAFEPVIDGDRMIWNLGDLRGLHSGSGRYVEIDVEKDCGQESTLVGATVYNNVMCNQVEDTNGAGQATQQDSAIAGLTSFSHDDSDSYEPHLYTGRLETLFANSKVYYNDGYPAALIHVVNSGNGALYNVRVPVELGSLINGTASLTFVEAKVTAVSGQASVTPGTVLTPVVFGQEYAHGYREITLGIDSMTASTVVTIELRLRMVLCQDLSLRIVKAHWGCPAGEEGSCLENLEAPELNSYMNILSGNAKALIVEHKAEPSVIDLCGSTTRMSIEVINAGGVDVYEPTIRERLPEGMVVEVDSVRYSINGGALKPFPEASGPGLRYSSLVTSTTPGLGDYQTLMWVFTDPNLDGDEADSLLDTVAYNDPYPDDTYFNRHKVLKPGTRIRIEFNVVLSGCANALAYSKSSRLAEATLLFDLPCHHDNRIYPDGTAVPEDRRFPLDDSTHRNSFLEPGLAHATIDMAGKNMTQDGALTFSQVNGEKEDQINWYITINSIGIGAVPDPTLEIFIPNVLAVDFANAPPVLISPANLTFTNANPTGVPHADGFLYTFAFDNSDPAMIAAGREHYFAATDQIQITFSSTVAQCSDEKPLVEAVINWGCCLDTPGLENASGSDHASTAVKTRPDSPIITVSEGDGGLLPAFDSCLGAYTITMTNPVLNNQLYLHEIDVTMVLPAGWTYAPLNGDGADFRYEGTGAREEDDRLTAAEEEPLIDGQTLRWTSVSRGGNIPDAKAKLFPVEVVKIVVYLRADGTGVNCDLDGKANPPVPAFVQSISLANYEDSCGDKLDSPRNANVSIVPKHPTLSISLIPSTRFINSTTTEVEWALRIQNIGDKDADNIDLEIDFGGGYSNVILKNGTPAPTSFTGNKGTWDLGVIGTVVPEQILLWTFTATIDTVNRGPLQVKAAVNGYCLERDGSLGCPYSFSEAEEFISGAMIDKVIDGTRLASPAVSTDPGPNSAVAKAADAAIGSIIRYLITVNVYEGGSNDLIVRDVLPVGLGFLEAYLVDHNGAWVADLNSTVTGDNTRVFSHVTNPSLAGITGGRLGNNALFLEIWAQVLDLPQNQEGIELENTAQLTVKRGNQTFDHNSPGLGLFESNKLTILEPHIQDDQYLTKTSEPTSLTSGHVGPELDLDPKPDGDNPIKYVFTARNTGSSPAYEVEFTDLFPWQLQNPTSLTSPYELLVEIEPAGGGTARQLTASTDFASSWTAGTKPNPATFKVNLLNTAAARLGIDETLRITYYGQVEYFAPGTFVDNLAKITSYSSLPGDGATLTTAKNTSLAESADERDNYANGYRDITERRTYHKFTTELISYGKIKSEITPHSDGVPPEFRDDGTTRATIGEQVEYWIRLSLPMTISLADLTLACDIPDGLTVRDAQWEVVTVGGDFSGGEKALSATKVGAITEVRGQAGAGADDFAQPLENMTNQDQELLIKLFLTVDRNYSGGASVLKGDSFDLPATFTWDNNEYTDSVDPIPQFTIVEPRLIALTKERTAHLQADNVTAATSPGTASYKNYYAIGPDNGSNATETVDDVYQVRPTDIIEYTVTFENDGDGAAWDIELRDLIPAGMTLRAGSTTISTTPADAGLVITEPILPGTPFFAINRVLPEHEVTVTYRCNVDSNVAAGRYLQNQVDLQQYSSLPAIGVAYPDEDRSVTSGDAAAYDAQGPRFEKLGTEYPTALKTVAAEMTLPANDGTVQGTIGELMTYTITVDIPDTTVLNDLTFLDVVPDGLEVKNASYVYNGGAQVNLTVTVNADGTSSVADTGGSLGDLAGVNGVTGELVITIAAMVKQKFNTATGATDNGPFGVGAANGIIDAGDIFKNNANFTWNQVNDEVTANTLDAEPQPVEFVIVEPKLEDLTKTKVSFNPAAFLGKGDGYRNYDVFGPNPENSGLVNDVDQVQPGHIVEYTLTITNNGDAIAYDVALFDRLNEFMTYVNGSASATVGPNATNMNFVVTPYTGLNTDLHFSLSQLEPGNTATVKYQLQVDVPVPAGRYLLNTVNLASCNSLPVAIAQYPDNVRRLEPRLQIGGPPDDPGYPRLDVAWADVGTLFPTATKTVQSEISPPAGKLDDGTARGTIGEMMTYEVLIDLPDNTIVYDLLLEDVIPANLTVQTETLDQPPVTLSFADVNSNGIITRYPLGSNELTISGNTVRLYLESDVQATNSFTNEIRLVLAVTVDDVPANVAGTVFANAVTTSWTQRDENPGYPAAREWLNEFTTPEGGTVDFTIIEPLLANNALTKARTGHFLANGSAAAEIGYSTYHNYNAVGPVTHTAKQDPVPNVYQVRPTDIVEYTLTFENTGNARAYDIALLDKVPDGFTLLSAAPHAPTITADSTAGIDFLDNPPTQAATGDPVEMKVNWLDAGDTATITYRMQIEPGIAAGAYLQNKASIEDYGTTPDATAVFPDLERDTTSIVPYAKPDPKFEKVGIVYPVINTKTVQSEFSPPSGKLSDGTARGTIGEVMTYEILIDIPDDTVLFDLLIEDVIPDNLTVQAQNLVPEDITFAEINSNGSNSTYTLASPELTLTGNTVRLYLQSDVYADNGAVNEIRLVMSVTVDDVAANVAGTVFANAVTTSWTQRNESPANPEGREWLIEFTTPEPPDTVDFTIIEPLLAVGTLTKARTGHFEADGVTPATSPGTATYKNPYAAGPVSHDAAQSPVPNVYQVRPNEILEYTLTFKNTGDATAYDIVLHDVVPYRHTLVTTPGQEPTVTALTTAGIAFLNGPTQPLGTGELIAMTINWLEPDDTATVKFRIKVEPKIAAGAYMQNQASIEDYRSTPAPTAIFPLLARNISSGSPVPYAKPYPRFEKVGSEFPVVSRTIQTELTPPAGIIDDGTARATIGEKVTYVIKIDIKDDLVLFNAYIESQIPSAFSLVSSHYQYKNDPPVAMKERLPKFASIDRLRFPGPNTNNKDDESLAYVEAENGLVNEIVITTELTVKQVLWNNFLVLDNGPFGVGAGDFIVNAGDVLFYNYNFPTFEWKQHPDSLGPPNFRQEISQRSGDVSLTIAEPRLDNSFAKQTVRVLDLDGGTEVTTTRGHVGEISAGAIGPASGGRSSYYRYPNGMGNPDLIDNVQVVLPGDYVEYNLEVVNDGTTTAFDVIITDLIPPSMTYVSGTGVFGVAQPPYVSGSPQSQLTVSESVEDVDGVNYPKLTFHVDLLNVGDTVKITYRALVKDALGAGAYIGKNTAKLEYYSTLPSGTFAMQVGNLPAGQQVHDYTLSRNTTNAKEPLGALDPTFADVAYKTQEGVGDDLGVQYPEFTTRVYQRYDVHGTEVQALLSAETDVRIGEVLIYELEATLPRRTVLFDGAKIPPAPLASRAVAYRHQLNQGYHLINNSAEFDKGDIDLSSLHYQSDSPYIFNINNRQHPTWYFTDVENTQNIPQTAIVRFQAEVKNTDYLGVVCFADQTVRHNEQNRFWLFWNTYDTFEKTSLYPYTILLQGDHPFLQRDNVNTAVVQPNLQLFKTSNPVPDSTVGVTGGVGDTVIYTLTLRNWNSAGAGAYQAQGIAYDIELTDLLPKDLAPVPPAEPTLSAAVHALDDGSGATGAVSRTLVRDSDYTYVYDFDPVTRQGSITFKTIRDETNIDYDARVEANQALVITYEVVVNPAIGAEGSGAGQCVNLAEIEKYQSLPATINDASRKEYGPEGPRRVALLTEVPTIVKASDTADGSVLPGDIVEYTLTAPEEAIRANLYEVEIRDELPDGLTFGADGTIAGVGLVPADILALNVGDGAGFIAGNEIEVTGIKGNATITITGRVLSILVDQIEPEGGADQVTVTVRALVKAQLDNGLPLNRLHEFRNLATLFWYDADDTYTLRARHASMSNAVSHFFDARGILFEPSHTGTAQPATIRTYRHWLRNFEENDLTVPIDFSAIQSDWIWQLFIGDGEGNVVSGPFESGHAVPVAANGATEVIMRVFVPAEITSMTTDVLTITATGAGDNVITVTDVTVVQVERVAVFKEISTTGDYVTRLEVQPADNNNINQRIRFVNNGPEPVKNVYVYDFIPENTAYVANSAVNNAEFNLEYSKDGGVNWLPGEPAAQGETVTNGLVPKVTNLRWNYDSGGTLIPGEEKIITFQLRIK